MKRRIITSNEAFRTTTLHHVAPHFEKKCDVTNHPEHDDYDMAVDLWSLTWYHHDDDDDTKKKKNEHQDDFDDLTSATTISLTSEWSFPDAPPAVIEIPEECTAAVGDNHKVPDLVIIPVLSPHKVLTLLGAGSAFRHDKNDSGVVSNTTTVAHGDKNHHEEEEEEEEDEEASVLSLGSLSSLGSLESLISMNQMLIEQEL